jgi:hypothetical protein
MQDLMAKYGVRITADAKTAPEVTLQRNFKLSALDLFWDQLPDEPTPTLDKRPREILSRSRAGTPEPTRKTSGRLSPDSLKDVPAFKPDGHMSRARTLEPDISNPPLVPPIPHPAPPLDQSVDFTFQASMLPRIKNAVATGGMCFWH